MFELGNPEKKLALENRGHEPEAAFLAEHDSFLENKEMYQLPGDPDLSVADLERYKKSNEKINAQLVELFEREFDDGLSCKGIQVSEFIECVPSAECSRIIERCLKSRSSYYRLSAAKLIGTVSAVDRAGLIKATFTYEDSDVQEAAMKFIDEVPIEHRTELIQLGFQSEVPNVCAAAMRHIDGISEEDQKKIKEELATRIQKKIDGENESDEYFIEKLFDYASPIDRIKFIRRKLSVEDLSERFEAVYLFARLPIENRGLLRQEIIRVLEDAFCSKVPHIRLSAIKAIGCVSQEDRTRFIEAGIEGQDEMVRFLAFKFLNLLSSEDSERLARRGLEMIHKNLEANEWDARFRAIELFNQMPDKYRDVLRDEVTKIMDDGLADKNTRFSTALLVGGFPVQDRNNLHEKIIDGIEQGLRSERPSERYEILGLIKMIPADRSVQLIERALRDKDMDVQLYSVEFIKDAPKRDHARLLEEAVENIGVARVFNVRGVIGLFIELPDLDQQRFWRKFPDFFVENRSLASRTCLYDSVADQKFFKSGFEKTGTELELFGKVPSIDGVDSSFREKIIKRKIPLSAYINWRTAFEAADFWKKQGFDYVPIEPIVKASIVKEGSNVDVFARVLRGPTVFAWDTAIGTYVNEISAQVERIKAGLVALGIKHGHEHLNNFVVVCERDSDDNVIFDRLPRVYMIDFDQALSKK